MPAAALRTKGRSFAERQINYQVSDQDNIEVATTYLNPGSFDLWRTTNNPRNPDGTTGWHLKVDFLNGKGFADVHTFTTGYHSAAGPGEVWDGETRFRDRGNDGGWRKIDGNDYDVSERTRHVEWR